MRLLSAMIALALAAGPARAHFIYLIPDKDQKSATMVFSDSLAPDERVPIDKISATKLFALDAADKPVAVKMKQEKHHYAVTVEGAGPIIVGGTCTYGVLTKKGDPFLLAYHPKTMLAPPSDATLKIAAWASGCKELPLEIVLMKDTMGVRFQGKPLAGALVNLVFDDKDEEIGKSDADGRIDFEAFIKALSKAKPEVIALRVVHTERKEGEFDGKSYKEIKHYATFAMRPMEKKVKKDIEGKKGAGDVAAPIEQEVNGVENLLFFAAGDKKADPAATKLLADARAARALWHKFPGFTATLLINQDGQRIPGRIAVHASGKIAYVTDLADLTPKQDEIIKKARGEIASLVQHRMPGGPSDTPCAFADGIEDHPQGRLINVLNDELHSSYRIRDRQILEVNRTMGEGRFTITVLENIWNKEKNYLPGFYVVNSWDKATLPTGSTTLKPAALKSSITHRNTWVRLGAFDLPESLTTATASPEGLSVRTLTFSNHKLGAE